MFYLKKYLVKMQKMKGNNRVLIVYKFHQRRDQIKDWKINNKIMSDLI